MCVLLIAWNIFISLLLSCIHRDLFVAFLVDDPIHPWIPLVIQTKDPVRQLIPSCLGWSVCLSSLCLVAADLTPPKVRTDLRSHLMECYIRFVSKGRLFWYQFSFQLIRCFNLWLCGMCTSLISWFVTLCRAVCAFFFTCCIWNVFVYALHVFYLYL